VELLYARRVTETARSYHANGWSYAVSQHTNHLCARLPLSEPTAMEWNARFDELEAQQLAEWKAAMAVAKAYAGGVRRG
jgi:hypothetical protein